MDRASTSDSEMEGGEDTAGVSPSPWDRLVSEAPGPLDPPAQPNQPVDATQGPTTVDGGADGTNMSDAPAVMENSSDQRALPRPFSLARPGTTATPTLTPTNGREVVDSSASLPPQHDDGSADEDDDDVSQSGYDRAMSFYPFVEDTSEPDAEEMKIIQSYQQHSALDDTWWEEQTYVDPKDKEVGIGDSGKIEWTVEAFNGTRENPRKELLLRSPPVRIGAFDWVIKLLPHGNMHTDRLSVYVENLGLDPSCDEEWPAEKLPLPALGASKLPRSRTVAAQIAVLVYNPQEPRVYEFQSDTAQFQRRSQDHGWTRFTAASWYDLHRRGFGQRQALLRHDRLALKAFIRILHDPTSCMWTQSYDMTPSDYISRTGLTSLPTLDDPLLCPVIAMWLHLKPVRNILYQLGKHNLLSASYTVSGDNPLALLQILLYHLRVRTISIYDTPLDYQLDYYINSFQRSSKSQPDIIATMTMLSSDISKQLEALVATGGPVAAAARDALHSMHELFGQLGDQFSGSRKTRLHIDGKSDMQAVIDAASVALGGPQLLTIELERQVFDGGRRRWTKLLNKVELNDRVVVDGIPYVLYGFAAHKGFFRSGEYSTYFRPGGPGALWYTYKSLPFDHADDAWHPECLTKTKAVTPREGLPGSEVLDEPINVHDRPPSYDGFSSLKSDDIAYVGLYVREDVEMLATPEPWDVPQWIKDAAKTLDSTAQLEMNEDEPAPESTALKGGSGADSESVERVVLNYYSGPFFEGFMKRGKYYGDGHLVYLNGNEYTGAFSEGSRHGQGTMTYQNGDTYEGGWHEGQHDGYGIYVEKHTGNVYKGNWREGKKHGTGTTFWKVSEEQSRMCRICFSAEADAAFYSCGHCCCCYFCGQRVKDCPVCRQSVRDVLRLFFQA